MKQLDLNVDGRNYHLCEEVPDIYFNLYERVNGRLAYYRESIKMWIGPQIYESEKIELWLYDDVQDKNAFAMKYKEGYFIAISLGLCHEYLARIDSYYESPNLLKFVKISSNNVDICKENLFDFMMAFTIAHELGHILQGHLAYKNENLFIDEKASVLEDNWFTQLTEFSADFFAIKVLASIIVKRVKDDYTFLQYALEDVCLAIGICFDIFAKNSNIDFFKYIEYDIKEYNHPHPGVRLIYSLCMLNYLLMNVYGDFEKLIFIINAAFHYVLCYEQYVLEINKYCDVYFSIGSTKKGQNHFISLVNDWDEIHSEFNEHSMIPVYSLGRLDDLMYSVDENGNFIMFRSSRE